MSTNGFSVDYQALDLAADEIKATIADGTRETQCVAYGLNYGHDTLAAAVITFTGDADQAVEHLEKTTKALATGLTEALKSYRAADARAESQITNVDVPSARSPLAPQPMFPSQFPSLSAPAAPFAPFATPARMF